MGGRGSGSGRGGGADKPKSRFGNPVKTLKKVTKEKINAPTLKTAKDIVPWVKYQSGVDLDKYRNSVTKEIRFLWMRQRCPKQNGEILLCWKHTKAIKRTFLQS